MTSDRRRGRIFKIIRRSKTPLTIPSPNAPTSTSVGQQTPTPLVPASASQRQLGSNKLASDIPSAEIAPNTTLIPPKGASIPVSSSVSPISQIGTVQQTAPFSQQQIGTVTNFCVVSLVPTMCKPSRPRNSLIVN